ncbi:hypothetical protein DFJ63DRAFT_296420 [Scheffersomyces coipomensis]|uniref:uncharacterized protein n=1 Tax=Scheffersomyces coipomensis TaxID=1788519 RepID=UPI00315D28C5
MSTPPPIPPSSSIDIVHDENSSPIKIERDEDGPNGNGSSDPSKRHKPGPVAGKKPSAEVLQRRKEGRIKAAATIAQNLKKTGIGRFEEQNGFGLTSVKTIPLINQKNYYTEYLKKDEQVSFVRNWRAEKLQQQNLKNLKKAESQNQTNTNGSNNGNDVKNFDDFDLNNIEVEMNKKKASAAAAATADDDEDEDDEEENENEEVTEEKAKIGHDVIIIHPGSSFIRIGRGTDAVPQTIPTIIAVPTHEKTISNEPKPIRQYRENAKDGDEKEIFFGPEFDEIKGVVTKDFRARMRYYKRRILPNSRETVANYNKKQESERIPDHNDPYKKEWHDLRSREFSNKKFFVGEDALKLPLNSKKHSSNWKLRYPIVNGNFNKESTDYESPQEILGDLANIIIESLRQNDIKNLLNLKVMLIIPDLYDKIYVETWCEILFKFVGFGRVGIIQESVAATFGAGATTACVIDVGSQTTSISCVDEGMIINDSRILMNYGGDQITECFIKLLLESSFPYKNIDLSSRIDDWELANDLKHNFVTFQDADIAVQLYNFYKRKPFEMTEKFEFKVFDEVMLAPLGLFYPQFFQPDKLSIKKRRQLFPPATDQYNGKLNNPTSRSQQILKSKLSYSDLTDEDLVLKLCKEKKNDEVATGGPNAGNSNLNNNNKNTEDDSGPIVLNEIPLEKAIIESITNAGLTTDLGKIKRFYDNLLIVGGGFGKINGFDLILNDRINIWRPKILSNSNLDSIIEFNKKKKKKRNPNLKKMAMKNQLNQKNPKMEPNLDDITLTEEDLADINKRASLKINFDVIDELYDQGTILPINILPPPREFDPEMLTWKGGSVYGRLKVVNEMWITQNDWDLLQSRCLYYKSLFNY